MESEHRVGNGDVICFLEGYLFNGKLEFGRGLDYYGLHHWQGLAE